MAVKNCFGKEIQENLIVLLRGINFVFLSVKSNLDLLKMSQPTGWYQNVA